MKTCLECGEVIVGREDKKFCGDGCRAAHNYKMNKDSTNFMRNINNSLRRNYRILTELNSGGKATTSRENLVKKGFDFEHFTGIRTTKKGRIVYYLYDQAYQNLSGDDFRLIRQER